MLNKFFRGVLTTTSISPMFIGIAIKKYSEVGMLNNPSVYWWVALFIVTALVPFPLIMYAKRKPELVKEIRVHSIEPADQEIAGFLVAYVLPLITDIPENKVLLLFTILFIWIAVIITHSYHFNPILSILYRYKFYKIDEIIDDSCTRKSILITKKALLNCKEIGEMNLVEISENMLLEVG